METIKYSRDKKYHCNNISDIKAAFKELRDQLFDDLKLDNIDINSLTIDNIRIIGAHSYYSGEDFMRMDILISDDEEELKDFHKLEEKFGSRNFIKLWME